MFGRWTIKHFPRVPGYFRAYNKVPGSGYKPTGHNNRSTLTTYFVEETSKVYSKYVSILRSSFRRKSGIPNNTSYYLSHCHFIMADRLRPQDKKKWKKELEKAGFSHRDGERVICYNCNVRPRSGEGQHPARLHAELCPNCKYVKDNGLVAKFLNEETGLEGARASDVDGNCARNGTTSFTGTSGQILPNVGTLPNPSLLDTDPRDRSKRFEEMKKKTTCMNCSIEGHSYIFLPCKHVFCRECVVGQSQCMKCGNDIRKIEWFYRC